MGFLYDRRRPHREHWRSKENATLYSQAYFAHLKLQQLTLPNTKAEPESAQAVRSSKPLRGS